jgi:ATP-dependent Clp protease ATP-binding subunit ClpA
MSKFAWDEYKQRLEASMPHLYLGKDVESIEIARAAHPLAGALLECPKTEKSQPVYDMLCRARIDHQAKPTLRTSTVGNIRELTASEVEHYADKLNAEIVGQPIAIRTVVSGLEAVAAGTQANPRAPVNFLMIGPTGTGKTEIAKLTAQAFNLPYYRIDMPNYKGTEGVWNLLGSPQGYEGDVGKLTSYVREHPSAVLLFDEVEKADPEMFDPLLTLIDEGRLTDRRSDETIDFSHTLIFFTSNLVSDVARELGDDQNALRQLVFSTRFLRREFVARIQRIVPFFPFMAEELELICKMQLESYLKQVAMNRRSHAEIKIESEVFAALAALVDTKFGARNVRSVIEQRVTPKLTRGLLSHQGSDLHAINLRVAGGEVEVSIE